MIAAQLGREAVAELLLKKGQIPTAGKENKQFWLPKGGKKTNNFWLGFRKIEQELIPREQGRRRESFYFLLREFGEFRTCISFVRGW